MPRYAALLQRRGADYHLDAGYHSGETLSDHKVVLVPEGQSLAFDEGAGTATRKWLYPYLGSDWHLVGFLDVEQEFTA